jgi:DNA primase
MKEIEGSTDSREISNEIKTSTRISNIEDYGEEKLPSGGDLQDKEVIVVEGRADVVNLVRNGINNVIGMNGTKLPNEIKKLGKEKDLVLFVDGDRGGKLIIQNVTDNAEVKYIAIAPDGKEVEELTGKEILQSLRKRIPVSEFFSSGRRDERGSRYERRDYKENNIKETKKLEEGDKEKLKEVYKKNDGSGKAIILDDTLNELKKVSVKTLSSTLKRVRERPFVIVIDGTATPAIIKSSEELGVSAIAAKNFSSASEKIEMLGF